MDTVERAGEAVRDTARKMKPRSERFDQAWQPFSNDPKLKLNPGSVGGALKFFNPTRADYVPLAKQSAGDTGNVERGWSSRDNRKGRHLIRVRPKDVDDEFHALPRTNSRERILQNLYRMLTTFPIANISYEIAVWFTVGSVIWILSSFFSFIPSYYPGASFSGESKYAGGISACAGSLVFLTASVLLWVEAVNAERDGCSSVQWTSTGRPWEEQKESCTHRWHQNDQHHSDDQRTRKPYRLIPTYKDFREHFAYEIGFWSAGIQISSSMIFLWSGLAALPGVYDQLTTTRTQQIVYWMPKLIACVGFVTSGVLTSLECQREWYKPAWRSLGYWIGIWKVVGSVGFLLMACFGFFTASWSQYTSAVCCIVGSFAFLVCSLLLWYESLAQYPVEGVSADDLEEEESPDEVREDESRMESVQAKEAREEVEPAGIEEGNGDSGLSSEEDDDHKSDV